MRYMLVALLASILTGCEEHNEVIDPGALTLPLRVNLRAGQSVRLSQLGFSATFDSVTSDSRCPEGAVCVWQGDGATRLSIIRDPGAAITCTLHTTLFPDLILVNGVTVHLTELDPYPQLGGIINKSAYVAVLEISRAGIR